MPDPYDELTDLELQSRGIPRITVRPSDIPVPPPDDAGWGRPGGTAGRPEGRLFEPDLSPAMGSTAAPATIDQNLRNRYMTTVQEPGQPDRESFELPAARAARERYDRPGLVGHLFGGARAVEPTQPWDPDRPRPGLASTQPPAETPFEYATRPITAPLRAAGQIAGAMFAPPVEQRSILDRYPDPNEPLTSQRVGREMRRQQALDKFGIDTALNLMGGGAPAGYARPGASAGMFGSRMSPKADQAAFDLAEAMARAGGRFSDEQIFQATKLRRFPDGKFYFEVSDQNARFKGLPDSHDIDKVTQQIFRENNPEQGLNLFGQTTGIKPPKEGSARYRTEMLKARQEATERIQKQGPLTWADLYDHPDALEAFPYLRDMPVYIDNEGSWRAAYYPPATKHERPFMAINPSQNVDESVLIPGGRHKPRGKMLEVGLHEPQHAIDFVEGGARGSNTSTNFAPGSPAEGIYKQIMTEFAPEMAKMGPAQRQVMEMYARNQAALANYNRSAGENRANLNYLRRDLTQAERDAIDPIKQMKIPSSQQIVEFNEPFAEMGGVLNPVPREMRQSQQMATPGKRSPSVPSAVAPRSGAVPEVAERYPEVIPPVNTYDPKTENWFPQKTLSEEAQRVQKARAAAQRDIDAGNYTPYFDPAKRADVNPANYPAMTSTKDVVRPAKEATRQKYEEMANTPEAKARLASAYERGLKQKAGSENWYFMKQLEDEFIKEYGATKGSAMFKERFADAMAATTGGADPTSNLMMAHYGNWLKARGEQVPPSHAFPFPIGGRYAGSNMDQFDKMIMQGQGISPTINPKRYNFSGNFTGYGKGATIDEQMMGLIGALDKKGKVLQMPPSGSYGHFEDVVHQAAKNAGVDPRYYQEVAWAGAKDEKTKGGFAAKPMIQIVNEAIERTHRITGMPRDEIVRRGLVRAEIPLYGAAGVIGGGAALGSIADQSGYQQ